MTETVKITFAQALKEALIEEMAHDKRVLLLGNNISAGGEYNVTKDIAQRFRKDRLIDIPPAEATAVGFALGLAATGAKPVIELDGRYILRAADAILNEVAKSQYQYASQFSSSMVIRVSMKYDSSYSAFENSSWESIFCQSGNNLTVVYPSTAAEAKGLLKAAIRSDKCVLFIENANYYDKEFTVPKEEYLVPLNKAEVKVVGNDLSVISYGPATRNAYEAIKKASFNGVSAELIDLRTLSPLDEKAIISSVSKTGKALIVHASGITMGLGSEIAALITEGEAFDYLDSPLKRIGIKESFIGYGDDNYNRDFPNVEKIYNAIIALADKEDAK